MFFGEPCFKKLVRHDNFFEFFAWFFDDNLLEKDLFGFILGEAALNETLKEGHLLLARG
jgi:hypothetical protein